MEYNVMTGKFGTFFVNPSDNGSHPTDLASINPNNTKYPEEVALMQYTGVKDTSGHDIYEGDLVNINGSSIMEVTHDGCLKDIDNQPVCNLCNCTTDLTIVGHIYQ